MELLVEQLARRVAELTLWRESELGPPAEVRILREDVVEARRPDFDDSAAFVLAPGADWREPTGAMRWLRFNLRRPAEWQADETALLVQRFGTLPPEPTPRLGRQAGQRMQGMLYLDGNAYHGLDQYHRLIPLPRGPEFQFAANIWTGLAQFEWQPAPVFRLARVDEAATQVYHDLRILHDALRTLEPEHTARPDLERLAQRALLVIDWSCPGSPEFRRGLAEAHALFKAELERLGSARYEPKLIAAGHAHIDCAWLWPIAQTREKAGRTWTTVLRLMERYPEYHFLASTPLQYEMVKGKFPETYAGIRQRVDEGRWEPLGGMWVEADCNLPDGESLARQLLVGTRYFEREFGIDTRVVWLPDSFGFTWALPTLMAAAGLPYFVTHKLSWNQTNRIPHDTFRWRGPDGSDVLAHFLCLPSTGEVERTTYNGDPLPSTVRGAWRRFQDRTLHDELLVAFGWGDGGGGPTIDMLEANRRLTNLPGFPTVQPGTAREFFERLEQALADRTDVPVWDGELYLEYHRGTYTSQAGQKLRNALSQRLYHSAELYAATARVLLGASYPREQLDEGWRLLLTNQFHDILPGSAISAVYVDARADYDRLAALGEHVLEQATRSIAGALDLETDALVVFNPGPYPSSDYLELPAEFRHLTPLDDLGQALPSQTTADGGLVIFVDGVPANGYRAFRLGTSGATFARHEMSITGRHISTPFWEIDLDERGRITRLWDKRSQREVIPPGQTANRLVVFEDKPLNYDAWDIDAYFADKSRDVGDIGGVGGVDAESLDNLDLARVREAGPERGVLEFHWRYGQNTRIAQRLCVYARSPRIDFITDVDWQERQSLLKVAFPTSIRSRRATYEIQFGTIDRPTHRNTSWDEAAFEVPAQRWVDLSDAHYGVAVIADCKHGYSVHEQTLWLSLLKSAIDPDPDADRGEHHFTYSLLPHPVGLEPPPVGLDPTPGGLEPVRRAAYDLTRPLIWRREPAHAGPLARQFSLAHTSHTGVIVETAKWAEDEDALILRMYEADGGATECSLTVGATPAEIGEVDLLERHPRSLSFTPPSPVPLDFRAHEIKTLRVSFPDLPHSGGIQRGLRPL